MFILLCLNYLGDHEHSHIDSNVVMEVCQKLSVSADDVLHAVRSGDRAHHLAIAYELVRDNRYSLIVIEDMCTKETYCTCMHIFITYSHMYVN